MTGRRKIRGGYPLALAAVLGAWAAFIGVVAPPVAAQPCPDVEVVFARGTGEPPGVGGIGQAFVDAVRAQAAPRSVGVYAVNYPAGDNFADRIGFASTVVDGIRDEGNHIQAMAANCPDTRLVLGGYSQGAVVSGFVTSAEVPPGVPVESVPAPLPPAVADKVAAVVLFATPSEEFLRQFGAPAINIGPLYAPKTLQLCDAGDSICSGVAGGGPNIAHALYAVNGAVNEGAAFAVGRL
ncbi:cutinase family protein [Mycolicibacterium pyrenivorans]|uniref:cutinase family protein n=1 Tax=Mycolicibacterium pyrenivorans TaxID=187102 RepID=UPI0021F290AB|nr:cutinase family protein [Mycolicibacterium pyrenivorans]MCV7153953.1 cutinase family protein [Mycolicibacterium pyrenivorans]